MSTTSLSTPTTPTEPSPTAELARGGAVSLAGSITSAAAGLALVVLLGNLLGDAGSGVVLQAIAVFTIALALARCGMDSAALWILPRLSEDDPTSLRPAVNLTLTIAAAAGVLVALVVVTGYTWLAGDTPDDVATAVVAIAWGLPLAAVLLTALAASRALGGVCSYVLVGNVGLPVGRIAAVALAVAIGFGTTGVAVGWALVLAPMLAAALLVVNAQLQPFAGGVSWRGTSLARRICGFGLPRVLSSVLEQLLLWLDVVLVGILAGPAAAGVYGAASRLVMAGTVVDNAVRVVVSPWFSRLLHRADEHGLAEVFRTATSWLVLFSTPIYLLLACFAELPLSLVGREFTSGATALAVLCAGSIITFLAGNVHSLLLMSGRSGVAAANKVGAVTFNIALLLLLVPRWGLTGASVAWAAAILLDASLAGLQVRFLLGLRVPPAAGLYPLAVALATVGVPAVMCRLLLGPTWWALGVAALIGGTALLLWARHASSRLHLEVLTAMIRRNTRET